MKRKKRPNKKKAISKETQLTLIYVFIALIIVGSAVALILYGPPDERLLRAVNACDANAARNVLEKEVDVNVRSDEDNVVVGAPAIFLAVREGCVEVLTLLLEHSADVDATVAGRLYNGWTALMMAANNGDAALVRLLLEHNADINAIIPEGEKQGWTALKIAESEGHPEIVHILKESGAK